MAYCKLYAVINQFYSFIKRLLKLSGLLVIVDMVMCVSVKIINTICNEQNSDNLIHCTCLALFFSVMHSYRSKICSFLAKCQCVLSENCMVSVVLMLSLVL